MASDVVYLSLAALVDYQIDGLAVVRYMEPVTYILPRSVYANFAKKLH